MTEEELTLKLWNDFDRLGYDYEQVKCLVLAMLLKNAKDKDYEKLSQFLSDVKAGYISGNETIN
ncbi:hypothetical protein ACQKM1_22545 [Peribacillus frigoritolerans]|uniref:hypothetical protein n=1 Tax=Peribacillus frigoritolerans TaxID=450367 RepID=UPI003D04B46E